MEQVAEVKEYKTSYEQCKNMISGVCSCCGGELEPLETVDNSDAPTFWSGCKDCNRFDWGCIPEVHQIAKYMVEKRNHVHYSHMNRPGAKHYDTPEYADYYNKSQIGGTASFVAEILRVQRYLREGKQP